MQATDPNALVNEANAWLAERDLLARTYWRPIAEILGIPSVRMEHRTERPAGAPAQPSQRSPWTQATQATQPTQRLQWPQRIPSWAQQVSLKKAAIPAPATVHMPVSQPRVPLWDDATWHAYQRKMLALDKVASVLACAAQNRLLSSGQRNAASIFHGNLLEMRKKFAGLQGPEDGIWDEDAMDDILSVLCSCVKDNIRPVFDGASGNIVPGSAADRFYTEFASCVAAYLEPLGFRAVGVQAGDPTEPYAKYFEQFLPGERATGPAQRGCFEQILVQPYRAYYGAQGQEELSEIWINGRAVVYRQ